MEMEKDPASKLKQKIGREKKDGKRERGRYFFADVLPLRFNLAAGKQGAMVYIYWYKAVVVVVAAAAVQGVAYTHACWLLTNDSRCLS